MSEYGNKKLSTLFWRFGHPGKQGLLAMNYGLTATAFAAF